MNDRILNVYDSENTNPLVYSCHFGPGELKEAIKRAYENLQLDMDEEDLEDANEYLLEEGEYGYRGGNAYVFKIEAA